jgi:hypothetical protein
MTKLKSVKLTSIERLSGYLPRMEGHASCVLDRKYVIVVGGWGPERFNSVYALDATELPDLSAIRVHHANGVRFKYGFTVVVIPSRVDLPMVDPYAMSPGSTYRILMYGGCTQGGYTGDCTGNLFHSSYVQM